MGVSLALMLYFFPWLHIVLIDKFHTFALNRYCDLNAISERPLDSSLADQTTISHSR